MSGVVVEVRVKEGQEIKKGDPVCGMRRTGFWFSERTFLVYSVLSAMKVRIFKALLKVHTHKDAQMESAVTAPVSGHVKRVVVQEGEDDATRDLRRLTPSIGDSINQGDLTVEIVH